MKLIMLMIFWTVGLQADVSFPEALSPSVKVEEHFQTARKFYLSGDRDGALNELNQALGQNPYHSGATTLYKTIRDEERDLRQIRLLTPEPETFSAPKVSTQSRTRSRDFLRDLVSLEGKTDQRFGAMEQRVAHADTEMNVLHAEISEQREGVVRVKESVERIEGRQNNLFYGLVVLSLVLVALSGITLRMLMKIQRNG